MPTSYPFLSLFSGGGFLDLGFWQAGFRPVVAVEVDPQFARAYREAFVARHLEGQVHLLVEDVRRLGADRLSELVRAAFPPAREGFGIVGGPPCQDFSLGGRHSGVRGERGSLVWDFLAKVTGMKPTFFAFENVKGLYAVMRHRIEAFEALVRATSDLGYVTAYRLLNALEYGLPQDRERVFVVGIREDVWRASGLEGFPWPAPRYPGAKRLPWPTSNPPGIPMEPDPSLPRELMVATAFAGVEGLPNQEDQLVPRSPRIPQIPEGDTRGKSFKRLHRYRYAPTVAYGHNEVHIHPTEPRRISVREALRLRGVPDTYVLPPMALSRKFALVSNGVPVPLAQALATSLAGVLKRAGLWQGVPLEEALPLA